MLGSNQRPLPCEGRSVTSWLFADVQKGLQKEAFLTNVCRGCSSVFAWVGAKLVSTGVDLAVLQHAAYRSGLPWRLPKIKSRRVNSYPGKGGCLNRSRTKRRCVYSARLPSDPRSSQRWADPIHHLGRTVDPAPTALRSQGPGRILSRIPNPPRPSP